MADKYATKAREARRVHGQLRCNEKRRFESEQVAFLHNRGQRPYQCPYCTHWHLASYKVRTAKLYVHPSNAVQVK